MDNDNDVDWIDRMNNGNQYQNGEWNRVVVIRLDCD